MITLIETAILDEITTRLDRAAGSTGIQKDVRGKLMNPVIVVAVTEGTFSRVGQVNWRQDLGVAVLVTFKHLKGEEARRSGINPLVQGLIQVLINKTLGLAITPLAPKRFRETTTQEQWESGVIEYLIELTTSFILTPAEEEELGDLLRIGLNYFLKPGDDIQDATDTVTLRGPA